MAAWDWLGHLSTKMTEMEGLDALPLVAQSKSVVQALAGNAEGALQTQQNFSRRCPVVSQLRSVVERQLGDDEAARQTEEEFGRSLRNADRTLGGALSSGVSVGREVSQRVSVHGPQLGQNVLNTVESVGREVSQRVSEHGPQLGQNVLSTVEAAVQRGRSTAEGLAQELAASGLGRQFSELLRRVERTADDFGVGPTADRDVEAAASSSASASTLDTYTLLTTVAPNQSGAQCPVCMELFEAGEEIRVLPCFHSLHPQCAEPWLQCKPECPVCRCNIKGSLQRHRVHSLFED